MLTSATHSSRGARLVARRLLKVVLITLGVVVLLLGLFIAVFIVPYMSKLDSGDLPAYHPFRSEAARTMYLARYDATSKRWPVPQETRTVVTRWGSSFVRVFGPEDGKPLVVLPGGGTTSLMWIHSAEALASNRRVYALDNLGDFGRSVAARDIRTTEEIVQSLDDVFSALRLERGFDLMGMSYGGWQAAEYAARHRDRLRGIVLIAPAATLFNLPPDFAWRGLLLLLPYRGFVDSMMRWSLPDLAAKSDPGSRALYQAAVDDAFLGMRCFRLKMMANPRPLTDAELASIKAPASFVVGEHETLYSAHAAIDRLKRVAPQFDTAIVEGAGHDLLWVERVRTERAILSFLEK